MKRNVIYTVLTGNYDCLNIPKVIHSDFNYVCFTDNEHIDGGGVWKIMVLEKKQLKKLNTKELSRYPKLMPHKFFPEYDYSCYIDANLKIANNMFYKDILAHIDNDDLWASPNHPFRDCAYEEGEIVVKMLKASYYPVRRYLAKINKDGFPVHYGLTENNIILRKHNNRKVITISEHWWREYLSSKTWRDQLSLPYIFWINNFKPELLFNGIRKTVHDGMERIEHVYDTTRISKLKSSNYFRFKRRMIIRCNKFFFKLFGDFCFK